MKAHGGLRKTFQPYIKLQYYYYLLKRINMLGDVLGIIAAIVLYIVIKQGGGFQ